MMKKVEDRDMCLFCRVRLIKQSKLNNIFSGMAQKSKCKLWQEKCAETLSNLLLGTESHPLKSYFINTAFCFKCTKIVIDMHFTWSQMTALENRMNNYLKQVKALFRQNFKEIPRNSIFGKGITSQLNWSNFNPGRGYSYDQVIQLFMSVIEPEGSNGEERENCYAHNYLEVQYNDETFISEADREKLSNFQYNQLFSTQDIQKLGDESEFQLESGNVKDTTGKLIGHVAGKGNAEKYREQECSDSGSSFLVISSSSSESEYSSSDNERVKRVSKKYNHNNYNKGPVAVSKDQNITTQPLQYNPYSKLPMPKYLGPLQNISSLPTINVGVNSSTLPPVSMRVPPLNANSSYQIQSSDSKANISNNTETKTSTVSIIAPETKMEVTTSGDNNCPELERILKLDIVEETKNEPSTPIFEENKESESVIKANDLNENVSSSEVTCLDTNNTSDGELVEFVTPSGIRVKAPLPKKRSGELSKIRIGPRSKIGNRSTSQPQTTHKSEYPQEENNLARLGTSVTPRMINNNSSLPYFANPKETKTDSFRRKMFSKRRTHPPSRKHGQGSQQFIHLRKKQNRLSLKSQMSNVNVDIASDSSDSILSCSSFSLDGSSTDSDLPSATKSYPKHLLKRRRKNSSSSSVVVIDSD